MTPWRLPVVLALAALAAACGSAEVSEHSRHSRAAPPPRTPGPAEYVVQRGDTLYSIAFRNQVDYHDLADWNGIGRDYRIYPGRVLRLVPPGGTALPPAQAAAAPAAPAPLSARPPAAATGRPPPEMPPDSATPPVYAPPAPSSPGPGGPAFDAGRWEWPTRGKLIRGFGADGSKGVDIAGDPGQIVVASAAGKVVYSGSALKGYGELVIIKHDEQYLTAYGYNRKRLVEEGQQVGAGQPIAELGEGPEQKPELHFEIRDRGRPVDPLPLLPRR